MEYLKWTKPIIKKLLNVLLKGLNTDEMNEANDSILMGKLVVDFIHYPVCPNPELAAGVGRHSDVSLITVLLQDDVGGLYVREPEGNGWIHVTPVQGALVINIGDVLQIMSNDKYRSIEHRVTVNGIKNRVSVPIFVNPVPDAVIGPVPEVLEGGVKPIYKQVVYSDYFNYFFSKGHDGKETIEYAKI